MTNDLFPSFDGTPAAPDAASWSQWAEAAAPSPEAARHAPVLTSLGLLYLRHGDAPRALVLGLTALAMGDRRPQAALMVADALLQASDPEQALAVLTRFDQPDMLTPQPDTTQRAACHHLRARALMRQGSREQAAAEMAMATQGTLG